MIFGIKCLQENAKKDNIVRITFSLFQIQKQLQKKQLYVILPTSYKKLFGSKHNSEVFRFHQILRIWYVLAGWAARCNNRMKSIDDSQV